MTVLTSKTQYKRSEKGEFHEIAKRNLNETLELILNYPWETERNLASIELTCPSVTIEHSNGTYLKIGPYFSNKFSIYFLNKKQKVYFKTFARLEEVCVYTAQYFEEAMDLEGFKKYTFTFNPISHFETNHFEYVINVKATIKFFRFPLLMIAVSTILGLINYIGEPQGSIFLFPIITTLFFLTLGGPLIYLYFNYLNKNRVYYLQLSRGHDDFIFGLPDAKKTYYKYDIEAIDAYGMQLTKCPWRECQVFIITLKTGEQLKFSSLLISQGELSSKFQNHKITDHRKFFPIFKA